MMVKNLCTLNGCTFYVNSLITDYYYEYLYGTTTIPLLLFVYHLSYLVHPFIFSSLHLTLCFLPLHLKHNNNQN